MNEILQQINSIGKAFVEFAGPMLIQSIVLILILLLADLLLRKKVRAVFRYWMWMLVLAKLILPTSLSLPMSLGYWFGDNLRLVKPHQRGEAEQTTQILQASPMPTPTQATPYGPARVGPTEPAPMPRPELAPVDPIPPEPVSSPVVSPTPLSWQGALFSVWLAVVIVMSLLLLQRAIFVRGLIAQAEEASGLMKDTLHYCCQQIAIKRKVSLKISPNASSPAVCGLFRSVILVPQGLAHNLGSDHLRVVLMHELAHIKRADLWINLVQTVLQIIYFYNPLLWLANAIIRRVREQAVDETVLVAMGEKAQQYPQTLLDVAKLAFKRPTLSLRLIGVVESKSALASRIKHILNRPVPKTGKLGVLGLIAIMITAAVLLPMAKSVNKSDVTAAGKNTEIVVVRWMAVLEQGAARDVLAISGREKTSSESYEGFICNSEFLAKVISQNLRNGKVIHISDNLTWIEPSPEYQRADSWADSANLAHPFYKGYTGGGAGLYKLGTTRWTGKLDLRYESVTCLLNPGPRISGKIFFQGDAFPGHALAFLGSLKENQETQANHLVVWQTIEVPSRLVPYIKAIHSTEDWIQRGPIGILNLAKEGFGRNKNLPAPATSSDKWMRTLPDGSKVKLVAVFRPKDNPFLFWDPDGKPVSGLPQWHSRDVAGRELAVVFERPQRIKGENPASDGRFYSAYMPVPEREIDSSKPVVACYGRGYGDWQEIGGLHEGLEISHLGQPYTLAKVEDRTLGERKQILVTMWYSVDPDIGIRLVAVDKKGGKYPMESADTWIGTPAKGHRTQYYEFAIGLSKEELSHFILQKRPVAWARFSDFATKSKAVTAEDSVNDRRSGEPQFIAKLPNGVTVELIGLCESPSEGKQWWGLDGQSIAKPYERLNHAESSRDYKCYEMAYRVFGSDDIASTIYSNDAVTCYAGPYPLSQRAKDLNIRNADSAYGAILFVKPDAQSILLEIGAGREPDWQALCTQSSPVDKTGTAGPGVVFQPAIEKDGKTYVTIAHQVKDRQIRVVAVDHLGQPHKPEGFSNTTSNELGSCQVCFDLPADQIKEIQFQTQEFQRVTFKNVSLKPGVKTALQIEVEKAAVRVEVLTDTPAVALDLDSGKLMQLDKDWPDGYDVSWDNDEGGSLFTKPDGRVKMLPIIEAKNFADALSIAGQRIQSLKQSEVSGIPAQQSKYILIKTSQDNVAVVEVQEFDQGKAKIGWQIIQQAAGKADTQPNSGQAESRGPLIVGAVDNKATLASGATVELLGLTYIPVTQDLWWRPDGSPLPQGPFDDVSFTPSVDPNWQQFAYYTMAIQIKGKPPQEVGLLKWDFTEAVYGGSTSAYAHEKRVYYDNIHSAAAKFPKAVEKTTLRLGIVSGDWQTIFAGRHYGFYEKGKDTADVRTPERVGGPGSVRPDEKGVHIEVTYNITDRDFRVVAVDKDGKVHLSSRSGSGGTQNLRRTTASFPNLTHDQLQEFRFQVRPYEWVEFKDITLRPGTETVALAEQRKAAKQKELEKWLGQGKERQIREQILILRESRLDHINEPCVEQTEAISAMRELVRMGPSAVPELTAELRLAEHWLERSLIAFVLRAIGDKRAVPALIDGLGKSNYRGEYGIYVKDDELAKFMLDHQHRAPDESERQSHAIIIACPVIEITKALERITGHSEGPERFSLEAAEIVKQRWQKWWDRNQ